LKRGGSEGRNSDHIGVFFVSLAVTLREIQQNQLFQPPRGRSMTRRRKGLGSAREDISKTKMIKGRKPFDIRPDGGGGETGTTHIKKKPSNNPGSPEHYTN